MKPLSERILMKGETKPINVTNWNVTREEISVEVAQLEARHHQHTYCAYCGEEFPVDTRSAIDAVEVHIFACEKHPISHIKKILRDEVWAEMTLGTPEEMRLFKLLDFIDDKALGGE